MKIEFSELAVIELREAIAFYESQMLELGSRFSAYIKKQVKLLSHNPLAFPKVSKDIRKFSLQKFPFKIYYSFNKSILLILSIRHQSKRPVSFAKLDNSVN